MCMPWLLRIIYRIHVCQYLYCIILNFINRNIYCRKIIELCNLCCLCRRCTVRVAIACCEHESLITSGNRTVAHCNVCNKSSVRRSTLKSESRINMIHYRIFKKYVLNTVTCMRTCCKTAMTFMQIVVEHP